MIISHLVVNLILHPNKNVISFVPMPVKGSAYPRAYKHWQVPLLQTFCRFVHRKSHQWFLNMFSFAVHINYVDNNSTVNDGMVYVTVGPRNRLQQQQQQHQQQQHYHHHHHPPMDHLPPSSPYNNSSSEKESTSSSTNLGNTFRTNHGMLFSFFHYLFLKWGQYRGTGRHDGWAGQGLG